MPNDPRADTLRRLHSAAGHLHAVIQMAENQAPCVEVLHQLSAVQGALRAAGCQLLGEQLQIQLEQIEHNCLCPAREQVTEGLRVFFALLAKSEVFQ